jgi:hypothetical protein
MKAGWLALFGLVVAAPAHADQLVLQIGRVGEVMAQEEGPPQPPLPGNMAGMNSVSDPRYVHLGTDISGAFCKQFGIEFRAANLAPGATALVQVRLDHPLWTSANGQTSTTELNLGAVTGDHWSYAGYSLEEDWSLVPGTWTFTISQGPRVLATVSFNLSVEPGQRMPADGCGAPTS